LLKLSKSFFIFSLAIVLLVVIGVCFYQVGLTLQSHVSTFQTSNTNMQDQLSELENQLEAYSNTSQTLQNYVNILESQLNVSTSLSQNLQNQLTSVENQLATSKNLSQSLQNEVNDLKVQLDDSTNLSQSLGNQINDLEAQLATSTNLSQTLQTHINDLEDQVANLSETLLSVTPVATFDFVQNFTMNSYTSKYYQFPSDEYRTVTLVVYVYTPVLSSTQVEVNVNFWVADTRHSPVIDTFVVNRFKNSTVVKTYDVIGSPFGFMLTNPTDTIVEGMFTIYMSS
jgi:myosin heavy subunit